MASFSSGYKSEFIALVNELEATMKRIIIGDIQNDINVRITELKINRLIKEFEQNIPDDFDEKPNMIRAALYSKKMLYNEFRRDTRLAFEKAKNEMGSILGFQPTTPHQLLTALMNNLHLLDAVKIKDVGLQSSIAFQKGTPYIANYYQRLRKAVEKMTDAGLIEPPRMLKRGLTMRSLAEMSIRQQFHQEQLVNYNERGIKLVWISTHADASKRCEKHQGKLFSLDGKTGSIDGHKYQPLENATQIPYKTKAGRVYMNGLFGFNCRHRMLEYKEGSLPPMDYSADEIRKEREITNKQRTMERQIFKLRLSANLVANVDKDASRQIHRHASSIFKEYVKFSHDNNHAYYPERCSIPQSMSKYIRDY